MTSTQKTWSAIIGAGLVIVGSGTYVLTNRGADQRETSTLATPSPSINITTAGEVPLTFQMATATADIQYVPRTMNERDLLETDFVNKMKALGFQRMWNFGDLAGMNYYYAYVPTGTTHGNGYNGKESDFPTPQGDSFKVYNNGVLAKVWPSDWLDKTLAFERVIGVKSDVCVNKKETWAQVKYKIDNSSGEYIKLGSETISSSNWKWSDYLTWAKRTRDSIVKYYGTTKKIIADEPNLIRNDKKAKEWFMNINPTSLTGCYGGRVYWQISDQVKLTTNQDTNIKKIQVFFNDSIPNQIAQFQRLFPGWKILGTEIVIVDNREGSDSISFVNKTIVGVAAWGRFYESFLKYQDIQPLAVQMSLKGLIDPEENNTKILTLLNTLLKPGSNVTAVTFENMEGVSGSSIHNVSEPKKHTLLINNLSKNTYSIQKVKIDGKGKSVTYNVQRMYSSNSTWQGDCVRDSTSSATLTILPCSVNVVSFQIGVSTAESKIIH